MSKLVGRGIVKTYGKKTVLQDVNLMLEGHKNLRYDRKKRSRQDDLALYSDRAESGNKGRNTVEWDSGMGK